MRLLNGLKTTMTSTSMMTTPNVTLASSRRDRRMFPPRIVARRQNVRATTQRLSTQPLILVLSAGAFALYLVLAWRVRRRPQSQLDLRATLLLQRLRSPLIARIFHGASWFGFRPQSLLLPSLTIVGFAVTGNRRESLYLVLAWLASLGSFFTKLVVRRPRPQDPLIRIVPAALRDTSFPSGHTIHYTAFWGLTAYFLRRCSSVPVALRRLLTSCLGALIALVGPSRVYLGHHWMSDVIGSYLFGGGWLGLLITAYQCGRQTQRE